jgi:hypothetical protein
MFTPSASCRRQEILPRLQNADQYNVGEEQQATEERCLRAGDEAAYGESKRKGCCEVAKIAGRDDVA